MCAFRGVDFDTCAISCAMISRALLLLWAKQSSNIPEPFKESLELFNDRSILMIEREACIACLKYSEACLY